MFIYNNVIPIIIKRRLVIRKKFRELKNINSRRNLFKLKK